MPVECIIDGIAGHSHWSRHKSPEEGVRFLVSKEKGDVVS